MQGMTIVGWGFRLDGCRLLLDEKVTRAVEQVQRRLGKDWCVNFVPRDEDAYMNWTGETKDFILYAVLDGKYSVIVPWGGVAEEDLMKTLNGVGWRDGYLNKVHLAEKRLGVKHQFERLAFMVTQPPECAMPTQIRASDN